MSKARTILITGSTDGLGKRVAEMLAAPDVHLLVHGRNAARGRAVVESIERAGGYAEFLEADFGSLAAVRQLAATLNSAHPKLDLLINNAGIAKVRGPRQLSADGFELHFAVNYLAPFLLTALLQPATIVNVVSAGQSPIKFDDVMLERGYNGIRAYGQSKLAEIMFTFDLAEDTGSTANCLHPGTYIDTAMVRDAGIKPITAVDTAAEAVLAIANLTRSTGRYFDGKNEARAHAQAYDPQARRKLKELTAKLISQ